MTQAGNLCPCHSEKAFADCCKPILDGKRKAATAEELLRARYCAFATGNVDFVIATHHSETVAEVKREEIETWSRGSEWLGLRVIQKEAGEASDSEGTIIFHARYAAEGKIHEHYEKSQFKKEKGEWKFHDAEALQPGPYVRQEPKIGRNDPCHCGSGKKFKKCHGQAA